MIEHLERYRIFWMTAQCGSFSRAADKLHISQPAVSHVIKRLEKHLEVRLFEREARGVKLTEAGAKLMEYVSESMKLLSEAEDKIRELRASPKREVRIGAGDALCRHYLLPFLDAFRTSYPDVKIIVYDRTSTDVVRMLKEKKLDLALLYLPAKDEMLHIREKREVQDCFVVGKKYKKLSQGPVTLAALQEIPLLMLGEGSMTRKYIERYFADNGELLVPEIELGSSDLLVQFAKQGHGAACVMKPFIEEELKKGTLFELPLATPIPTRKIGVATLKNGKLTTEATRLAEALP